MSRRPLALLGVAALAVALVSAAPARATEVLDVDWTPWPAVGRTATVTAQGLVPGHAYDVVLGDAMTVDSDHVVADTAGAARVRVGVDADFTGEHGVEVRFQDADTGHLVAGSDRFPDFPSLAVSGRNPLSPVLRVKAFAEGESVRFRYGRGLSGAPTTGDVGDFGTSLTLAAKPTGTPFTTTVTATGATHGRTASATLDVAGDTLRVGQRVDSWISWQNHLAHPVIVAAGGRWSLGVSSSEGFEVQGWSAGAADPVTDTASCRYLSCTPPPNPDDHYLQQDWLELRSDGNLVRFQEDLVAGTPVRAIWSTGTAGTGADNRLVIGADGVLRLTTAAGREVWNTRVGRIYASGLPSGATLPVADTLRGARPALLTLQTDGNLVYRSSSGAAVWSTRTAGRSPALTMQTDGNLVLRTGTTAVWSTRTAGRPGSAFGIQSDGNLVVRDARGAATWALWGLAGSPLRTRPVGV